MTRLIASSLYGVKSWDPAVFITVPIVLSAVAFLATWMPAVRASKARPDEGAAHRLTHNAQAISESLLVPQR